MPVGNTLSRYIGAQFLRSIAVVFFTVFGLVYVLDFVELVRRAGDVAAATPLDMAHLALLRTPSVTEQVLPFAVLIGAMTTLLNLSRKLELVVVRAAGISAWQFLTPGLVIAGGIGVLSILAFNPVAAMLKQHASEVETRIFSSTPEVMTGNDIWIRQRHDDGSAIIRAGSIAEGSTEIASVMVYRFDLQGRFRERIEAGSAELRSGHWDMRDVRIVAIEGEPERFSSYQLPSSLDPEQLRRSFTPPESVPFWNLREMAEQTRRAGLDATAYQLRYESLLARPLLFVAMVLVAASVSLRFFRFGGVGPLVLGGVAAGFLLYVATELMEDLGASGLVGTTLAAWFPAVVGSLLGVLALLYQEDG